MSLAGHAAIALALCFTLCAQRLERLGASPKAFVVVLRKRKLLLNALPPVQRLLVSSVIRTRTRCRKHEAVGSASGTYDKLVQNILGAGLFTTRREVAQNVDMGE